MRYQGQNGCCVAVMVMVPIPVRLAFGQHERVAEQGGGGRVAETGEADLDSARSRRKSAGGPLSAVYGCGGGCSIHSGHMHRRYRQFVIAGATGPPAPTW